jgi:hypothetical protein
MVISSECSRRLISPTICLDSGTQSSVDETTWPVSKSSVLTASHLSTNPFSVQVRTLDLARCFYQGRYYISVDGAMNSQEMA